MFLLDLPITQNYFQSIVSVGNRPPNIGYRTKTYELLRSLVAARMGYAILIMTPRTDRAYDGSQLVSPGSWVSLSDVPWVVISLHG